MTVDSSRYPSVSKDCEIHSWTVQVVLQRLLWLKRPIMQGWQSLLHLLQMEPLSVMVITHQVLQGGAHQLLFLCEVCSFGC